MTRVLAIVPLCALLAGCATAIPRQPVPAATPHVAIPAAPPPGEPGDLAGLHSTQLRVVFGVPSFVRKEGTAEMWRYDGASCKAFFFLYPFADSLLVRHVETLPRGREMAADDTCLNSLRAHVPTPVS